jgi:16S rRNA (guanine527-N7)-methyltransferase
MKTTTDTHKFRNALENEAAAYGVSLAAADIDGLSQYYELLQRWNSRVHLVAPCSPQEFAMRHILESLILLKYLPSDASVVEVGAGAGLPILPCLIVRRDLRAVLIEASKKKAVFLREALVHTGIHMGASARASVIDERFESIVAPSVGFVTCRALERFDEMLPHILEWAPPKSTLLLFGGKRLEPKLEGSGLPFTAELMPHSKGRFLFVVNKG